MHRSDFFELFWQNRNDDVSIFLCLKYKRAAEKAFTRFAFLMNNNFWYQMDHYYPDFGSLEKTVKDLIGLIVVLIRLIRCAINETK